MQMRFCHSKTLYSLLVDFFTKRAQICAWNAWWNAKRKTEITWNNAKNVSLTQHGNAIVKKKKFKDKTSLTHMPQFWQDDLFAAPFLGLFIFGRDVGQYAAPWTKKGASKASTWICRTNRAYVSSRNDTDEANSVTWLRRPIGLIKNLLEGPSAFLMQSQHSGFRQMFYSLCLNINGMWWMLNAFVDIFAQSPVDYARGNCVCMCVFVRVRMLDWIPLAHG